MPIPAGQPRQVAPKPVRRWLRESVELIIHGPVWFGAIFAALCGIRWLMAQALHGLSDSARLGALSGVSAATMMLYPALCLLLYSACRTSDCGGAFTQNIKSLPATRKQLLVRCAAGAVLGPAVALAFAIASALGASPERFAFEAILLFAVIGELYLTNFLAMPVAICDPSADASLFHPERASHAALRVNGAPSAAVSVALLTVFASLSSVLMIMPWALTIAVVTFFIILEYVAYRDIFEHQDGNRQRARRESARVISHSGA